MKVTRVGASKEVAPAKKKGKVPASGAGSFADSLKETQGVSSATEAGEQAAVAGVDGILAAQTVADPTDDTPQRRRMIAFGDDLLDQLEDLRIGILTGSFSKEKLTDLAQKLRQKRGQTQDPVLNGLIQEIELRAEVEIAKYSRRR